MGVFLGSATLVRAQSNPIAASSAPAPVGRPAASLVEPHGNPLPPIPETIGPEESFWSVPDSEVGPGAQDRLWVRAEYLLWWISNGPINTPLVTTGSPQDAVPGALDQGGTQVLFGDRSLRFGALSGLRLTAGVDLSEGLGLEAGYFALERRTAGSAVISDENGNPLIARPVFNNQAPAENAYLYALPGTASGSVIVTAHTQMQGAEFNLTANLCHDSCTSFTLFTGFRFLELKEDLNIIGNVTPLVAGFLTFAGGAADPPNSVTDFDSFKTSNKFYGGQIGGRFTWHGDRFDVGVLGKLALGATQELIFINGVSALNTPGAPPTTNPGGLLAEPSNINRYYHSNIELIPEVGIDLGYRVTPQLRITLGYSVLYWSRVARPGNQIDRVVSAGQVARDPTFGTSTGDNRPVFQLRESDFWAQGLNFGLEFQY
jgi:hypothetical protein